MNYTLIGNCPVYAVKEESWDGLETPRLWNDHSYHHADQTPITLLMSEIVNSPTWKCSHLEYETVRELDTGPTRARHPDSASMTVRARAQSLCSQHKRPSVLCLLIREHIQYLQWNLHNARTTYTALCLLNKTPWLNKQYNPTPPPRFVCTS